MRQIASFLLVTTFILFTNFANSQTLPFRNGEKLIYSASFKWGVLDSDIAELNMDLTYISDTNPYYHAKMYCKTYKLYDIFYKVRDLFESKFYAKTLKPIYFHRDIKESKYRMVNIHTFLPDNKVKAYIRKYDDPPKDTIIAVKPNTYDLVTLFFKLRSIDFSTSVVGIRQMISFIIDDDAYDIYITNMGKETIKLRGFGNREAYKISCSVVAGEVFDGKEDMYIWISADADRVPLIFEAPMRIGRIVGKLKEYK